MKKQLKVEVQANGFYADGHPVSDFTAELLSVKKNWRTGQRSYLIRIRTAAEQECIVELSAQQLKNSRWIASLPILEQCEEPGAVAEAFLRHIISAERGYKNVEVELPYTGFQKNQGKWHFVFANGAITEVGFDSTVRALNQSAFFNGNRNLQCNPEETMKFLDLVRSQAAQVYPMFALNLMSVSRNLFREYGLDISGNLWVYGGSGSGKTTLSQVFGMFTEPYEEQFPDPNAWHRRRLVSSIEKIPQVVKTLQISDEITVVVDDIKPEPSQRQREKSWAVTDIVVRSVYQGATTEDAQKNTGKSDVGTCAILNGEYRNSVESQSSRMLIVSVDGFLKDSKRSEMLRVIQDNLIWQRNLIGSFIQWLISQTREENVGELWRNQMNDLRRQPWIYENMSNGQRLKDTKARFYFITKIFCKYLTEKFPERNQEIDRFMQAAVTSLDDAVVHTFEFLGGISAILHNVMKNILNRLVSAGKIRRVRYVDEGGERWNEAQFCFLNKNYRESVESALYIPEVRKSFDKTEQRGRSVNEGPILIMRRDDFEDMLQEELQNRVADGELSEKDKNRVDLAMIAKEGFILAWPRYDGPARYSKPYPELYLEEQENWDGNVFIRRNICVNEMQTIQGICFNLNHQIFQGISPEEFQTYNEGLGMSREETREIVKIRRSFLNGQIRLNF